MTGSGEAGKSASGDSSRQQSAITCRCGAAWTAPGAAHCAAAGCHELFASVALFDLHRDQTGPHGRCIPPDQVVGKDGESRMFFRNGMWRGPEMTEEQRAKMAKSGEGKTDGLAD